MIDTSEYAGLLPLLTDARDSLCAPESGEDAQRMHAEKVHEAEDQKSRWRVPLRVANGESMAWRCVRPRVDPHVRA
jgi:hypothetical protein